MWRKSTFMNKSLGLMKKSKCGNWFFSTRRGWLTLSQKLMMKSFFRSWSLRWSLFVERNTKKRIRRNQQNWKKTVKRLSVEFASFMATRRILQKRAVVVMNAGQKMQTARDVAYADSMIQQNAHVVQSATPVRKVVESALNAMSMMNVLAKILSNDWRILNLSIL